MFFGHFVSENFFLDNENKYFSARLDRFFSCKKTNATHAFPAVTLLSESSQKKLAYSGPVNIINYNKTTNFRVDPTNVLATTDSLDPYSA